MQNKSFYWFGYKLFNRKVEIQPQKEELSKPFLTYEEAKINRIIYNSNDYLRTSIFQAISKEKAEEQMSLESFNKL